MAVAMALPELLIEAGVLSRDAATFHAPVVGAGAVVLSGSASAMTNAQVAAFKAGNPSYRLDPLVLAEEGVGAAKAWLEAQPLDATPMIYATATPDEVRAVQDKLGRAEAGALVEAALGDLAVDAGGVGGAVVCPVGRGAAWFARNEPEILNLSLTSRTKQNNLILSKAPNNPFCASFPSICFITLLNN